MQRSQSSKGKRQVFIIISGHIIGIMGHIINISGQKGFCRGKLSQFRDTLSTFWDSLYIKFILNDLCWRFEQEVRNPDFMFGGEGSIVEIDEAFISKMKYGWGRHEKKEGIWVVGMTPVPVSSRRVDDPALLQALIERESARQRQADLRATARTRKTAKQYVHPLSTVPQGDASLMKLRVTHQGLMRVILMFQTIRKCEDEKTRSGIFSDIFPKTNQKERVSLWLKSVTVAL